MDKSTFKDHQRRISSLSDQCVEVLHLLLIEISTPGIERFVPLGTRIKALRNIAIALDSLLSIERG